MKGRPLVERLGFPTAGLAAGERRERSLRAHAACAGLALLALVVLQPAPVWWALVAIAAAGVIGLELLDSAVEGVIDLLHPGWHAEIKVIKDMVAGAVLIASLASLGVAAARTIDRLPVIRAALSR